MVKLERSLGLLEVTLMSICIILGAGVYVLIGEAAGLSGNALWLSFIFAAFVASLSGLSCTGLSSRFPHADAEYVYAKNAFVKNLFIVENLYFLPVRMGFEFRFSAFFYLYMDDIFTTITTTYYRFNKFNFYRFSKSR